MLKAMTFSVLALLATAACGDRCQSSVAPALPTLALKSATLSPEGFATIVVAPPAAFTPVEPSNEAPPPLTSEQIAAQEQFQRAAEFQHEVREEVEALTEKLLANEKGNFVDLYYENEGQPHVVFRFLHDGPQTLRKYTRNPRFLATDVRYSRADLKAAMEFMFDTFGKDRVIQSIGIGSKSNRAEVEITVPPDEFWSLVAKKGVKIPETVKLNFRTQTPAAAVNTPLPPDIANLVRIFPRDDRPVGVVEAIESRANIVLNDGCFRVSGGNHDGAFVLFPLGAQLFVDSEGYLAFGTEERPGYARVGEEIVTPGVIHEVVAPELVNPIRTACGPGKVVNVNGMSSASAGREQMAVTSNANALRWFTDFYGLTDAQANRALEQCKKNFGGGMCATTPPPPHMPNEPCPAGTSLSGGLCRTPDGYVRPLPEWLRKIVAGSEP